MKPFEIRYETTTWVPGSEPEVRSMTAEELGQINAQSYDHMLASTSGLYRYRDADGEWIERSIDGCGMGTKCSLRIVHALQLHPGVFPDPRDIAEIVGNRKLRNSNTLAARIARIRAAHGGRDQQRFFISRRNGGYALKWDDFSWIWIDRIPNPLTS